MLISVTPDAGDSNLWTRGALVTTLLEQLAQPRYQFCLVDCQDRYEAASRAIRLGTPHAAPDVEEVIGALKRPDQNVIASLVSVAAADRPHYFASLLPRLHELGRKTGHPHWTVLDDAHQLLPSDSDVAAMPAPGSPTNLAMVTVAPELVSSLALQAVGVFIAVGGVTEALASILHRRGVHVRPQPIAPGMAMLWRPGDRVDPVLFAVEPDEVTALLKEV
jgi:hypothetical protein